MISIIAGFKGEVITPADSDYTEIRHRWARNATKDAAVIACVKDEADVVLAVRHAQAKGLDIAVKCKWLIDAWTRAKPRQAEGTGHPVHLRQTVA